MLLMLFRSAVAKSFMSSQYRVYRNQRSNLEAA